MSPARFEWMETPYQGNGHHPETYLGEVESAVYRDDLAAQKEAIEALKRIYSSTPWFSAKYLSGSRIQFEHNDLFPQADPVDYHCTVLDSDAKGWIRSLESRILSSADTANKADAADDLVGFVAAGSAIVSNIRSCLFGSYKNIISSCSRDVRLILAERLARVDYYCPEAKDLVRDHYLSMLKYPSSETRIAGAQELALLSRRVMKRNDFIGMISRAIQSDPSPDVGSEMKAMLDDYDWAGDLENRLFSSDPLAVSREACLAAEDLCRMVRDQSKERLLPGLLSVYKKGLDSPDHAVRLTLAKGFSVEPASEAARSVNGLIYNHFFSAMRSASCEDRILAAHDLRSVAVSLRNVGMIDWMRQCAVSESDSRVRKAFKAEIGSYYAHTKTPSPTDRVVALMIGSAMILGMGWFFWAAYHYNSIPK